MLTASERREQFVYSLMVQSDVTREQMQTRLSLIARMLARAFPQIASRARQVDSSEAIRGAVGPSPGRADERGS